MFYKKVLITGARGFIGSHLSSRIRQMYPDSEVLELDRDGKRAAEGTNLCADLLDKEALADIISEHRPECVFHLAGIIYSLDWTEHYRGNVETTINIFEALKRCAVQARVVVPGSAAEYGRISPEDLPIEERTPPNPVSPYGVVKVWQTTAARYYATQGMDAVVGRMFNVIGRGAPKGLSIGSFAAQLRKIRTKESPPEILVGNLSPRRDFVDVDDACLALVMLAEKGGTGGIYNICSGVSVSMEEILCMMIERAGLRVSVRIDPRRVKASEIDDIYGSNERIREETGWRPAVPLSESIDAVISGI